MAMTNEDIIQMAREAGIPEMAIEGVFIANSDDLGRLIAAEREACAKLCADIGKEYNNEINKKLGLGYELQEVAFDCEAAIRARGQHD